MLEENHFVNTRILKMSNSKLFGFSNHVDTLSKALALYGINFTISVAIAQIMQDYIKLDLGLYNIKVRKFINLSEYSFKLMWLWVDDRDIILKEQLIIPCLIHELGKSFISSYLPAEEVGNFSSELTIHPHNISFIEKKFTSFSSSEITALILKQWKFDKKTIDIIENIDFPNSKATLILDVIKTIFNVTSPFSKESISLAVRKADNYDLDVEKLKKSLQELLVLIKNDL